MAFSFDLNSQGYLKKRESFDLEYKQNFQLGDNLLKYIKTMIGMANNRGGEIVFGVKDSPHILIGMTNNKFVSTDPKTIDAKIREVCEQYPTTPCIVDFYAILLFYCSQIVAIREYLESTHRYYYWKQSLVFLGFKDTQKINTQQRI